VKEIKRPIFRLDAIRHYAQRREESVLPRLVSPRTFLGLWLLLGLLVASGFLAWFARVPMYASGSAVVIDSGESPSSPSGEALIVAFVPPEHLQRLRVGQILRLHFDERSKRLGTPIIAVEPGVSSPEVARRRFGLGDGAALAITQPSAIVLARLQPPSSDLPAAVYVGSVYHTQIEVDSRRVISLLPLIGQIFGE
jgi:hypothetical protein